MQKRLQLLGSLGVTAESFSGSEFLDLNREQLLLLHGAWVKLLTDSPTDGTKPLRVIRRFSNEFVKDPRTVIRKMASLGDTLLDSLGDTSDGYVNVTWCDLFMDTPVFREYLHFFRTKDFLTLQYLMSFLWYGKKAEFEDPSLIPTAFRRWEQVEDRLRDEFEDTLYVNILRKVLSEFMPRLSTFIPLPVHGSGVVAEKGVGRSSVAKNDTLSFDPRIDRVLFRSTWLSPNGIVTQWDKEKPHSRTQSRLFFVRKNAKTARSICFEPATIMAGQQAVRLIFEQTIKEGPFGRHIFINDQTVNRLAALYGSCTRRVDTIDLSDASDSVAWSLVRSIFPTKVRYYLQATRTREVELPNGQMRPLKKFAPMGSALCFPTQCVIYASICIAAGILWGIKNRRIQDYSNIMLSYKKLFNRELGMSMEKLEPFYVYGDDIICDTRITPYVTDILKALDFTVNMEKSFTGNTPFRESCGGFYFNGGDVTPLLYRIPYKKERGITAQYLAAFTAHVNLVGDYGFKELHSFLLGHILYNDAIRYGRSKAPLLFTDAENPPPFTIYSTNPRNDHLVERRRSRTGHKPGCTCRFCSDKDPVFWNISYKALKPIITEVEESKHDVYHYVQWQRSKYASDSENSTPIGVTDRKRLPLEAGIGWGWMPA